MFKKIRNIWRNFIRGIKNLVIWFPTVWKDRQWDHQFIYMMMRHKLHLTEQCIRNYGYHVNNIQDADQIKECIDILDRLINDEYHEDAFESHLKIWGKPEISWGNVVHGDDEPLDRFNINYPNVRTNEDKKKERSDFKLACKMEEKLQQSDLHNLFLNMERNIRGWWD
jgi:hypothetical protein